MPTNGKASKAAITSPAHSQPTAPPLVFAGNLALATLARGGVYIAGGIARKIAAKMNDGGFMRAFVDKGRFADLLRRYPVHIVTDPKVGLKGALNYLQLQG